MRYQLHTLAVLRGVCDSDDPGKFFGSLMALSYWIEQAIEEGLIIRSGNDRLEPTSVGRMIYDRVLSVLPCCRQVFWSSPELSNLLGKGAS